MIPTKVAEHLYQEHSVCLQSYNTPFLAGETQQYTMGVGGHLTDASLACSVRDLLRYEHTPSHLRTLAAIKLLRALGELVPVEMKRARRPQLEFGRHFRQSLSSYTGSAGCTIHAITTPTLSQTFLAVAVGTQRVTFIPLSVLQVLPQNNFCTLPATYR